MARKSLSPEEKAIVDLHNQKATENVRRLWDELQERDSTMTQEKAAILCGWTQGNFNHYLTGKAPIGSVGLNRLCMLFNCEKQDIREEYKDPMREELMNMISDAIELVAGAHTLNSDEADRWVDRANKIMSDDEVKQQQSA